MRHKLIASFFVFTFIAATQLAGQQPQAPSVKSGGLTFKSQLDVVLVDVIVRDKTGAIVKGLTINDFEVQEDGKKQDIKSVTYEEISTKTTNAVETVSMLANAADDKKSGIKVNVGAPPPKSTPAAPTPAAPTPPAAAPPKADEKPVPPPEDPTGPMTSTDVAGHRLMILLFDTSSMQPEDVQKAADSAIKWAEEKMSPNDFVAVASIGATLNILTDFTTDKDKVHKVLMAFSATDGTAPAAVDSSTMSTDETNSAATDDTTTVDVSTQELDSFNNDVRLRGIKTLCESLMPIQQKKAILYFSSGMARNGSDNQVEMRAAENACSRSNTTLNPVDSRGLQAVVAGGSARNASKGGAAAFTGSGVRGQFTQLAAEQETLQALAADTGGTAFTDSNDFGEAFTKVTNDISAYYMIGYSSSNNAKDGKFRRISVRLKDSSLKMDRAREGYYADKDFTHSSKDDRELQLQEQLMSALPATDVPMFVTAGYFRLIEAPQNQGGPGGPGNPNPGGRGGGPGQGDQFYVPISLVVPGEAIPMSAVKTTMDVRGAILDERGDQVGTIKDTITVPPSTPEELVSKQVMYQTGVQVPAGQFAIKVVVRENATGKVGTFEALVRVPQLRNVPVKVSSVILSTQLQSAVGRVSKSPLIRDGVEIVPNLTHVISRDQMLYFYYEVYNPTLDAGKPQLRTNLSFYRGKVKVFETPLVESRNVDVADRKASVFQFQMPASQLKPGLYTCQVNIIDEVSGKMSYPRLEMYIR